ncbi:hypothetical protein [Ferrovibrio xuzhouensis]|uniref:Uncharacterized protein n=1 Tax=Ferrovibrio xuzhouensis TaxID=1576914 RepID=A0ABV7VKX1_9PROT
MFGFLFGRRKKKTKTPAGQQTIPMTHEIAMTVINGKAVTVVKAPFPATQSDDIARVALRYYLRAFPGVTSVVMVTTDPMDTDQRAIFIGSAEFTAALSQRRINDFQFSEIRVEVPFVPWFLKEQPAETAQSADGDASPA